MVRAVGVASDGEKEPFFVNPFLTLDPNHDVFTCACLMRFLVQTVPMLFLSDRKFELKSQKHHSMVNTLPKLNRKGNSGSPCSPPSPA